MARLPRVGRLGIKECVFGCGRPATSKEDVWPRWLLKRFRAPTAGLYATVGEDTYADPKQKRIPLKCVCVECNTGWMKRLEDESIPVLSLLGQDLTLPLGLDDQVLISAWALKMAMLWEYFGPPSRTLYHLEGDREGMRSRTIPANTTVWLARYGGAPMLFSSVADGTDDLRLPGADTTFRAYATDIVFGRLMIQVLSRRSLMHDARLMVDPVPGPWEQCAVTVWPPRSGGVAWPPRLTLVRDVPFEAFRRRWPRLEEASG